MSGHGGPSRVRQKRHTTPNTHIDDATSRTMIGEPGERVKPGRRKSRLNYGNWLGA